MTNWMVSGFYTPDYAHWYERLKFNLMGFDQPFFFAEAKKLGGGWEANCLAKAGHVADMMARFPNKTIVWIDVDCQVTASLEPLARIPGDIGVRFYTKGRRGRAVILRVAAGTLVFKPNEAARRFVHRWRANSATAPFGEDDEATLTRTVTSIHGVAISQIDDAGLVKHDYASKDADKVSKVTRWIHRQLGTPSAVSESTF